jgi:hypothetical protein
MGAPLPIANWTVTEWKDAAQIIQVVATLIALGVGLFWFLRQRKRYPKAITGHSAVIRELMPNDNLVRISVCIENKGETLLELQSAVVCLFIVSPTPASIQALLTAKKSIRTRDDGEAEWPEVTGCSQTSHPTDHEIEPGEVHYLHFDFAVPSTINAVFAHSYVKNVAKRRSLLGRPREIGWNFMSFHDIKKELENGKEGSKEGSEEGD